MARQLRICLVGGIYGKDAAYRARVRMTPETTLEEGLRQRGHAVTTSSHYSRMPREDFDAVHVHHLGLGTLRAAMHPSATPLVFTLHDPRVMQSALSPARNYALRLVLARADAVVALSAIERDFLYSHYGMAHPAVVIPNGIDEQTYRFVPPSARAKHPRWRLLYVGQLVSLKRVDLLLEAVSTLRRPVELSLVYHVSDWENRLKTQAQALGIADRVHFLGSRSPQQLAQLYAQADLFVLPSSGEALPSVLAEAMFCGTPVVATRVGGVAEQVGSFGVTVPPNCAEALAAAIEEVLAHYGRFVAQAGQMSAFARSRASIEVMIENHVQMYTEMASLQRTLRQQRRFPRWLECLGERALEWLCQMKCANSSAHTPGPRKPIGGISS